jgi:flagellar biosynthesis protein FliQ
MTWEDWLTFGAAVLAFVSVAMSLQDAHWVKDMPPLWPTMLAGLLVGMLAARTRMHAAFLHPLALLVGVLVVILMAQTFADGANIVERINDFRIRMRDWFQVVVSGDISNDNLPFVTLVQGLCCLSAYMAAWSIYRWRSPWPAIVPGGIVILANISFLEGHPSGWFVTFLFGAIVLIARLYLQRRQNRWQRQGVEYPDFLSLSAIQLTILSAGLVIFAAWQLPLGGQTSASEALFGKMVQPITDQSSTFVRLFHNIEAKKGLGLHSFGDYLTVQSDIQLGNRPVAQVTVKDLPDGKAALIRATSYDTYTGAGWKTADRDTNDLAARDDATGKDAVQFQQRAIVSATVRLLDSSNTLFTVGTPLKANVDAHAETAKNVPGDVERLESKASLDGGDSYATQGSVSTATAAELQAAGGNDYPAAIRERYLQLPKELPARVKEAAAQIGHKDGAKDAYDEAVNIATYLQTLPFDLTVPIPPPGQDMVDYFLFDAKKGYFDYNSTSMAVMLRAIGVPARVAVGFVLDPKEKKGDTFTVTRQDTFSWVEVYFPNYGWVTFNPTPVTSTQGPGGKPTPGTGLTGPNVIPPVGFNGLFPPTPEGKDPNAATDKTINQSPDIHSGPPWTLIWSFVGLVIALIVAAIAIRIGWNHGLKDLDRRSQLWTKVQRAARLAGIRSRPYETPREFSRRVGIVVQREAEAKQLADAYEEARYGRPDSRKVDTGAAERAYAMLRNTLLGGILRRRELKQREKEIDYRPFG